MQQVLYTESHYPQYHSLLKTKPLFFITHVYVCSTCMYSSAAEKRSTYGGQRRALDPQDWHYEMLRATMGVLELEPWSSNSALNPFYPPPFFSNGLTVQLHLTSMRSSCFSLSAAGITNAWPCHF